VAFHIAFGLSAGTAQAQRGAPDFHVVDNKEH
jgi:hypothetical protein